jgi:hypothetical protein
MFHPKGKPALENIGPLIGMVEVEGIPPPMLQPKLDPPPEGHPGVGIITDGMGVEMLGIWMDGKEDTTDIPQIEGPVEMGIDGVGQMAFNDGKVDIIRIPPITLMDGIKGSATLDKTLGPDLL